MEYKACWPGSGTSWQREFKLSMEQVRIQSETSPAFHKVQLQAHLLYIDDLPDQLRSTAGLFADDCVLCFWNYSRRSWESLRGPSPSGRVAEHLGNIMLFNPSKYSVMKISTKISPPDRNYTFCGDSFQEVTSHPYWVLSWIIYEAHSVSLEIWCVWAVAY